jgi:hypothetical protein
MQLKTRMQASLNGVLEPGVFIGLNFTPTGVCFAFDMYIKPGGKYKT